MPTRRPGAALVAVTALTLSISVSACGNDSPAGITGDPLNAAETTELVNAVFGVLDLISIPLLDNSGPAATPYGDLYDDQIDGAMDCAGGGSASVTGLITGDVDQQAETADISVSATVDFVSCVVEGQATVFSLNGDPDVDLSAAIDISPSAITIDIDSDGYVAFETEDGRSGSCRVNLGVSASATQNGVLETRTGSVCGVNASQLDVALFD